MKRILPVADWPEQDQTMWRRLVHEADPFDEPGPLAHLRQTSQGTLARTYGQWLSWLSRTEPAALPERPEARAHVARLGAWLEDLSDSAPFTRLMLVEGTTLSVLQAAAPEQCWKAQKRLVARLRAAAAHTGGQRKVGRVPDSRLLLEAGLRHAGPEADEAPSPFQAARRRRDGVMIALLALMPMRRRAFCGLRLGRSLIPIPGGFLIALDAGLTKTGQVWKTPAPDVLVPALRRYLDEARPYFMARSGAAHDALWVTERGAPIPYASIEPRISTITEKLLGVRVPPHFFRDAAATTLARTAPEQAGLIKTLLGHSTQRTADWHYNHAPGIEAGRDYAAIIERRKRGKS